MHTTNPHRAGSKAAARWDERQARRAAKEQAAADLAQRQAAALERAQALSRKPPPEYGNWGVTRTAAWMKVAGEARRLAGLKRPRLAVLEHTVEQLSDISTGRMGLDACSRLAQGVTND